MHWSTGPAPCPPLCQGKFHPSSVTIDRRSECRIGVRDDRDRAVLGWGWLGLAGLGWGGLETRDCEARAPSKLSIGLALFDPDHRAVSCTPSRTRPRTGPEGLDAARPAASTNRSILSDQRATALPLSVCLRSPSPQRICLVPHFAL